MSTRTKMGYAVIVVGMLVGLIINYFNYRINLKGKMGQQGNVESKQGK
ncbi:hypothetical protein [Bacillus niameyensis]|nr:hypothetical protein [Bacillus niameyensis]